MPIQGPNYTVATACSTGLHSVGDAFRLVRNGDCDVMLGGGTEFTGISRAAFAGFSKIRAMNTKFNDAAHKASRPFDKDRAGFIMGEGAAVLVLEELNHAKKRGVNIYGEILGYGMTGLFLLSKNRASFLLFTFRQ